MGGLASSGRMSPLIALLVLAGYLIVSAESYLATHAAGVFRISFAGVGPTELRIVLAAGAIAMTTHPAVAIGLLPPMWLFDVGGIVATAGLIFVFVASALRNTRVCIARTAAALESGMRIAPSPESRAGSPADARRRADAPAGG